MNQQMIFPPTRREPHHCLAGKARWIFAAPHKRGILSTGELLMVALILNKPDWIEEAGYSLTELLERLGAEEICLVLKAARSIKNGEVSE